MFVCYRFYREELFFVFIQLQSDFTTCSHAALNFIEFYLKFFMKFFMKLCSLQIKVQF